MSRKKGAIANEQKKVMNFDLDETLLFQMHRIHSVMFRVANGLIQDADIPVKMEQLPVIMCIFYSKPLSQQELANLLQRDKSSVQRTVQALHRKGFLDVQQDKIDKRQNIVRLTENGNKLALQIRKIFESVERRLFSAFGSDDKKDTIKSIRQTADKLELLQA